MAQPLYGDYFGKGLPPSTGEEPYAARAFGFSGNMPYVSNLPLPETAAFGAGYPAGGCPHPVPAAKKYARFFYVLLDQAYCMFLYVVCINLFVLILMCVLFLQDASEDTERGN